MQPLVGDMLIHVAQVVVPAAMATVALLLFLHHKMNLQGPDNADSICNVLLEFVDQTTTAASSASHDS